MYRLTKALLGKPGTTEYIFMDNGILSSRAQTEDLRTILQSEIWKNMDYWQDSHTRSDTWSDGQCTHRRLVRAPCGSSWSAARRRRGSMRGTSTCRRRPRRTPRRGAATPRCSSAGRWRRWSRRRPAASAAPPDASSGRRTWSWWGRRTTPRTSTSPACPSRCSWRRPVAAATRGCRRPSRHPRLRGGLLQRERGGQSPWIHRLTSERIQYAWICHRNTHWPYTAFKPYDGVD